jgi:hypothetical protein
MEIRSLHVNISYSVTEAFLRLNTPKSIIEVYLQCKRLYSLTYTNNEYDGFTGFVTIIVLLRTQLSSPRGWRKLGVEMVNMRV